MVVGFAVDNNTERIIVYRARNTCSDTEHRTICVAGHAVAKPSGENAAVENPATATAAITAYFARIRLSPVWSLL